MKKYLPYILVLFCQLVTFAQTFKGIIKNTETNQPIGQITLTNTDNTFFVTSNEKGEVVLPETVLNQKLFIDDYGYGYNEKVFTNTENFVWELTPNSETLEEIIIFSESYYRENYYENNEIASYAEGLVDFYIGGNTEPVLMLAKQTHTQDFATVDEFNRYVISTPNDLVGASMRFNVIRSLITDKKSMKFM